MDTDTELLKQKCEELLRVRLDALEVSKLIINWVPAYVQKSLEDIHKKLDAVNGDSSSLKQKAVDRTVKNKQSKVGRTRNKLEKHLTHNNSKVSWNANSKPQAATGVKTDVEPAPNQRKKREPAAAEARNVMKTNKSTPFISIKDNGDASKERQSSSRNGKQKKDDESRLLRAVKDLCASKVHNKKVSALLLLFINVLNSFKNANSRHDLSALKS